MHRKWVVSINQSINLSLITLQAVRDNVNTNFSMPLARLELRHSVILSNPIKPHVLILMSSKHVVLRKPNIEMRVIKKI